ncbi:hypothetical protein HC776_02050 [bacterium]|nr:hypothetical protein [bacterium]
MTIGGILGFVSLIGFLLGVLGVALAVMAVAQGRAPRAGIGLAIVGFVLGAAFAFISTGLLEVGVTEVAVGYNTVTGRLEEPRGPGIHVVFPGVLQITRYPTNQREYTMSGLENEGLVRATIRSQRDLWTVRKSSWM